jgi:hypothetical protein
MHLSGEVVDTVADYLAIFVLVFVPALLIYLFWMVHILPEKIAERRGHPQADAIKTLCLLSLVFGGLLWPLAWLWAYTKPVLHKIAYGTDRVEHPHSDVVAQHATFVEPETRSDDAGLAVAASGKH